MRTTTDRPTPSGRTTPLALAIAALLALAGLLAAPAIGSTSEERQGAQLLSRLQAGKTTCTSLTTASFERIGASRRRPADGRAGIP